MHVRMHSFIYVFTFACTYMYAYMWWPFCFNFVNGPALRDIFVQQLD